MDNILRDYCSFGYYQKRVTYLLASAAIATGPQAALLVFVGAPAVYHWDCAGDGGTSTGTHGDAPHVASAVGTPALKGSCQRFGNGECSPAYDNRLASATAEFGLICDKATDASYAQSLYFLGMLMGSWLAGFSSDAYGRRSAVLLGCLLCFAGSVCTTLATSFLLLAFSRCLAGLGSMCLGVSANVLVSEMVAPLHRAFTTTLANVTFSIGLCSLTVIAYAFANNWRHLMIFLTGEMLVLCIFVWMWTAESPHWLLSNKKLEQLEVMLSRWARKEGKVLPEGIVMQLMVENDDDRNEEQGLVNMKGLSQEKASLLSLLSVKLRFYSLSLIWIWFSICLMYYGLSFHMKGLGDNKYVSFFLMSLVEVPSLVGVIWILKRVGRKTCIFWALVMTSVFCCISMIIATQTPVTREHAAGSTPHHHFTARLQLAVSICGKFTASAVFSILYTYTPELLPTTMRTSGLGVCVLISRIGAIISPFILALADTHPALPYAIFTVCGALSLLGAYRMPETFNKDLPETAQDLDKLVSNKSEL